MRSLLLASAALVMVGQTARSQPPAIAPPMQLPAYQRAIFNPYPAISPSPNSPTQYAAKPAISPYLNLLRGGELAANYYLDVVPLLQLQKKLDQPAFVPPRIDPKLEEEFKDLQTAPLDIGKPAVVRELLRKLLAAQPRLCAVLAANDRAADGAVSRSAKQGILFALALRFRLKPSAMLFAASASRSSR